jgi:hypothetical protein
MQRFASYLTVLLALALSVPGLAQTRTFVSYVGCYSSATEYNLNDMVSTATGFYISLAVAKFE